MKLAVVMGAGGMGGWAFHLGVALAIEETFGQGVAEADLLVGTSAGAAIGASLRCGATVDEVLTSVTTPPSENEQAAVRAAMGSRRTGVARFLPLSPGLVARGVLDPRRVGLVMAGALPSGIFPTMGLSRFPGITSETMWPSGLWLPAVRVTDGAVVVFGRDHPHVGPADAIEASSAVPGMFQPKQLDEHHYVDGATASANHAHLAAEITPDLVVISSVQSRPGLRASRILARRQLPAEIRSLEQSGARVAVVEPDSEITELIAGFPRSNGDRGPAIVDAVRRHANRTFAIAG